MIIETTTGQKSENNGLGVPRPNQYTYSTTPTPKAQGTSQRRRGNIARVRDLEHLLQDFYLWPMQSQQYGFLKKTWKMTRQHRSGKYHEISTYMKSYRESVIAEKRSIRLP